MDSYRLWDRDGDSRVNDRQYDANRCKTIWGYVQRGRRRIQPAVELKMIYSTENKSFLDELREEIARLTAERDYWAKHTNGCPGEIWGSSRDACNCGLKQALDGTLWTGTDSEFICDALQSLQDLED